MKSRKGVEMSMQTMVIAALSLIILVVLIMLFTGQLNVFKDSVNACKDKGSNYGCFNSCEGEWSYSSAGGCGEDEVCCVRSDSIL